MNFDSPEYINQQFQLYKEFLISKVKSVSDGKPIAYILGGQGASGKSDLINLIDSKYSNRQFLIINGDDYRAFHPDNKKLMNENATAYSEKTQLYSNIFTENLIKEAINGKYNVIIEGTMRNSQTPFNTARLLHDNGFEVHAAVIAAHPKITEISIYCRYQNEVNNKGFGRLADISSHNMAAANIGKSVDYLHDTKSVDTIHIYKSFPLKEIFVTALKMDNGIARKSQVPLLVQNEKDK